MAKKPAVRVVAGDSAEYRAFIQANRGTCDAQLCAAQSRASSLGWRQIEICATIYGWSLRYASGLQGFGLILGHLTLREAVTHARQWAKEDSHCFTTLRTSDLDLRRRLAAKSATRFGAPA